LAFGELLDEMMCELQVRGRIEPQERRHLVQITGQESGRTSGAGVGDDETDV
jgi:hypothetical protein